MHLGRRVALVAGEELGGYGTVVDVASVEGLVGWWGADGGGDAEGGSVGEGGGACEVKTMDSALVPGWCVHIVL